MKAEGIESAEVRVERRGRRRPPQRNWFLISACLLLVLLSAVLWMKWRETRATAAQLQAEVKKVYADAERLRTEVALAQQRIGQLEQQVRLLTADRERLREAAERPRPAR
jgi:F0F1-type ATP synthase membrane subunit b/b'